MTNPEDSDELLFPKATRTGLTVTLQHVIREGLNEEQAVSYLAPIRSLSARTLFLSLVGQLDRLIVHEVASAVGADEANSIRLDRLGAQRDLLLFLANAATMNLNRNEQLQPLVVDVQTP